MFYYYPKPQFQEVGTSYIKYIYIFFLIFYTVLTPMYYELFIFTLIYTYMYGNMALFFGMLIIALPRILSMIDFYFLLFGGQTAYRYKKCSLVIQLASSVIVGLFTVLYVIVIGMDDTFEEFIKDPMVRESILFLICNGLSYPVINEQPSQIGAENYLPVMSNDGSRMSIPMQPVPMVAPQSSSMPVFIPYFDQH